MLRGLWGSMSINSTTLFDCSEQSNAQGVIGIDVDKFDYSLRKDPKLGSKNVNKWNYILGDD